MAQRSGFQPLSHVEILGFYIGSNTYYNHGVLKFANGNIYEGNWKDGKYNGHGVCKFADGRVLDGQWKDDKFLG